MFESEYDLLQCQCSLKFFWPSTSSIKVSVAGQKTPQWARLFYFASSFASSVVQKVFYTSLWCHRGPLCLWYLHLVTLFLSSSLHLLLFIIHESCKCSLLKPIIMIRIIKWNIVWDLWKKKTPTLLRSRWPLRRLSFCMLWCFCAHWLKPHSTSCTEGCVCAKRRRKKKKTVRTCQTLPVVVY